MNKQLNHEGSVSTFIPCHGHFILPFKLLKLVVVASSLLVIIGCDWGKKIDDGVAAVQKAANTLDRSADQLASQGANFGSIAEDVKNSLKSLPKEWIDQFGDRMTETAERAAQAAGIQAQCTLDMARHRLAEDLHYLAASLRARLLKRAEPARPSRIPTPCDHSPQSAQPNFSHDLVWNGYDFKSVGSDGKGIRLALSSRRTGVMAFYDVLNLGSDYKAVATLTRIPTPISAEIDRIVLVWEGKAFSEVGIDKPQAPRSYTLPVNLAAWGPFRPPNIGRNDAEFAGHGPMINWSVLLQVRNGRELVASVSFHATEWEGDVVHGRPVNNPTICGGHMEKVVYSAPVEVRILRIIDKASDGGSFVSTKPNSDRDPEKQYGTFYPTYEFVGDTQGDDVGKTGITAPGPGHIKIEVLPQTRP
jgi:hypothetical protein